jgi:hypothetical protein
MIFAGAYLLGSRKTCRKSLSHKGLRRKIGGVLVVSPYAARVYVQLSLRCTDEHFRISSVVVDGHKPAATATILWADTVD